LTDASQQLSMLKQQSEATQTAAKDAAAARDEAQKQLAEAQPQLTRAAELEAVSSMRSAFLTEIKKALGTKPGVQVTDDRLVIASEGLFTGSSSILSPAGRESVKQIAIGLRDVAAHLAPDTDWLVRVDGHADKQPAGGRYPSNWDLSAARAVSVVRALVADGIPADRLVAEGFGDSRPLDLVNTPAAYAKNRRVEIRLTQR
jgi:chemotaxis protein MotB